MGMRFKEAGVEYIVCCVLNDRSLLSIPKEMVDKVQVEAGVEDILWPLGAYVIFQPNGVTLALFGTIQGERVHRGGIFDPTDMGQAVSSMWQALRDTPNETLQENLKQLVHETFVVREVFKEITPEALDYFQGQYVQLASDVLNVSPKRVRARLYFIETGHITPELYLDNVLLNSDDDRFKVVTNHFENYLSTAKPN